MNQEIQVAVEQAVVEQLKKKNFTIACAESCSGGLLTARLTDIFGVSQVLMEGIISYSNESKIKRLGVSSETLKAHGAVSRETAEEMAIGVTNALGSNVGISITGIAGPNGGTAEKPVGLVYIGISINGNTTSKELRLLGNRQKIRENTVVYALKFLLDELVKNPTPKG